MNLDDQICYCYHVSLRKLVNFARRECPTRASQMSNCLGAGTGCGWCIPILVRIHEKALAGELSSAGGKLPTTPPTTNPDTVTPERIIVEGLPESPESYASARKDYLRSDEKNKF